jgi:hypothetical protein
MKRIKLPISYQLHCLTRVKCLPEKEVNTLLEDRVTNQRFEIALMQELPQMQQLSWNHYC